MKKILAAFFVLLIVSLAGQRFVEKNYVPVILMYHCVGSEDPDCQYANIPTEAFERQMEFLKVHKFNVMALSTFLGKIKSGKKLPLKTVAITFDDGTADNFKNAFPVLKKMRFPATIFMITGNINKKGWLSDEDLKILNSSGIEIGSHTVNHVFLPKATEEEVRYELLESKRRLEWLLQHPVTLFSYPAGGVTREVRQAVLDAGYTAAVTTNYGDDPKDPLAYRRVKVGNSASNLFSFLQKVSGFYHVGRRCIPIK